MLSEPNISYKPFWGICRPLNSWRANSPNPIQIYCAGLTSGEEMISSMLFFVMQRETQGMDNTEKLQYVLLRLKNIYKITRLKDLKNEWLFV